MHTVLFSLYQHASHVCRAATQTQSVPLVSLQGASIRMHAPAAVNVQIHHTMITCICTDFSAETGVR